MSTQQQQRQGLGFMPYHLESNQQSPYYGSPGGTYTAPASAYNSIPQHSQDVTSFDSARTSGGGGAEGSSSPKGQGYLDYFDNDGGGFIGPADGNDIHIPAAQEKYASSSGTGAAFAASPNQYPSSSGGEKYLSGTRAAFVGPNQYPNNNNGQLANYNALRNRGQFVGGFGGNNYGRNGGLAGGYSGGVQRQPYQSPCSKGILNPILTLGTLAGLAYGAYQFVTWLGREDKRKRSSSSMGADLDMLYSPLMYGMHISMCTFNTIYKACIALLCPNLMGRCTTYYLFCLFA